MPNRPKKLVREGTREYVKEGELQTVGDLTEVRELAILKIKEELEEIVNSGYKDTYEFADLLEAFEFLCFSCGQNLDTVKNYKDAKAQVKGNLTNIALINLNPNNKSNKIYFQRYSDKVKLEETENFVIDAIQQVLDGNNITSPFNMPFDITPKSKVIEMLNTILYKIRYIKNKP